MRREDWARCIVAATGPSLTPDVANECRARHAQGWKVLAVNDAWRILPFADAMYTTDRYWWDVHGDVPFAGERWASNSINLGIDDDKRAWGKAEALRINLVDAADGNEFCTHPGRIHYGSNSGFAAVNLAIQLGATEIKLVGFDMKRTGGREHFFGDHPPGLHNGSDFAPFIYAFTVASKAMPNGVTITQCTPDSALRCFPMGDL